MKKKHFTMKDRKYLILFSCLFVLICAGVGGCSSQGLRDPLDNRIGQTDAPPELREQWYKQSFGKPVKDQTEPEDDSVDAENRTLNARDQVITPTRTTPSTPWAYTPQLNFGSGEEHFSDELIDADFNFNGASITQVIPAFSKILGFSYVLEGSVSGTATISMKEKISKKDLWNIFANLLRVSKLNANYDGKVLRVRSTANIPVEVTMDTMNPNVELGVFHLKNIPVKSVTSMLKTMVGRDLRSIELERNNTLVILDTTHTMPQLKQLINELDHPIAENLSREIIVCRNIAPKQIQEELKKILPILGFQVGKNVEAASSPGTVTISTIDRLNLLIASASNPSALQELKQWVTTLDDADSDQEQLYIYEIINSRADFMAKALAVMFTVTGSMVDTDQNGKMIETGNIGTPSSVTANSTVVPGSVFDVPVRIWADNSNNRLAIRTRPRTYATIKAYLERIDTIPSQVLLQVLVFEVTLTDTMQFGMEFNTQNAIDNWQSMSGTEYKYLTPGSGQGQQYGMKFWLFDPDNKDNKFAYINALAGLQNIKVISAPQLQVLSNHTATMTVGEQVPIITQDITDTSSSSLNGTSLKRSVSYKDTGVTLKVTPRVTRGGRITLTVNQSVSEAQTNTTSSIDSPQVSKREVTTAVSMRDGSMVVCGGMIREKLADNLDSLPIINNIPFLRRLLGATNSSAVRSEMLVLITGTIITDKSKLEEMTSGYEHSVNSLIEFTQKERSLQRFTNKGDLTKCFWK